MPWIETEPRGLSMLVLQSLQNWTCETVGPVLDPFGSVLSGPVPEGSRVNRRPIRSDFRTGSIWIRSLVNIA